METTEAAPPAALGPLASLAERALAPVSPDAPTGADLTYDPAFEALKARVDAIGAVDVRIDQERALQGESLVAESSGTDYGAIAQAAETLLGRTKDVRVASYLAVALFEVHGARGLAAGLYVLAGLCEQYWEALHPPRKRLRGRLAVLSFADQHLAPALEAAAPTAADRPALEAAQQALGRLNAALKPHTGSPAPHLLSLSVALDGVLARLPEAEPEPPPAPAEPTPAAPRQANAQATAQAAGDGSAAAPEPPPAAPVSAPAPAAQVAAAASIAPARSPVEAARAIVQACGVLREAQPADAVAFRLARVLRWDVVAALPPHSGGATRLEAPHARRRDYLRGLAERSDWETLAREGEAAFCEHPNQFWLDLQRLLLAALDALGPAWAAARAAVASEAARLAARLPGLAGLSYSDGTPFADPATQQWLEALAARSAGGAARGGAAAADDGETAARIAEAEALASDGSLDEAAALLQRAAGQAAAERDAFGLRLALARLFARAGRTDVARPLLDALDEQSRARALEAWEPALALQAAEERFRCLVALERSGTADAPERRAQAAALAASRAKQFDRLCRLDAARAAELAAWAGQSA